MSALEAESPIPRITLKVPAEAAQALGVSRDHFDRRIRPHLKVIRSGALTLVTVEELRRWGSESVEFVLGDPR